MEKMRITFLISLVCIHSACSQFNVGKFITKLCPQCGKITIPKITTNNIANLKGLNMSMSTYPPWFESWMSLYSSKSLEELVVPGTHHSGMYWTDASRNRVAVSGWSKEGWALTQYLTVEQQLMAGVRWLDVRNVDGKGLVSHGPESLRHNGPIKVEDIFEQTVTYLKSHPSEVVVIQLKGDSAKSAGWEINVLEIINKYPNLIYRSPKLDGETTTPVGVLSNFVQNARLTGDVYSVTEVRYWEDCFTRCQRDGNCIGATFMDAAKLSFQTRNSLCLLMSNAVDLKLDEDHTGYNSYCKRSICARGRIIIASEGYLRTNRVFHQVTSSWRYTKTPYPTEIAGKLQTYITVQAGTDKRTIFKILDAICTPTSEFITEMQLQGNINFSLKDLGPRCNLRILNWIRSLSAEHRSLVKKKITTVNTDYLHPDMVSEIIKLND